MAHALSRSAPEVTPAALAIEIFNAHLKRLVNDSSRLAFYPPIDVGDEMPDETWNALWHACRQHGYDARLQRIGPGHPCRIELTRRPGENDRGPGDDFANAEGWGRPYDLGG